MFGPVSDRSEHKRFQADSKRNYDMLFKVVLTGECNSGKSRILQQFLNQNSEETKPTIGVEFTSKLIKLDGKVINMQLWDTAGSEKFRAVTKHYYRGAHGVILVYDITSLDSFNNLTYWLQQVKNCTP